MELCMRELGLTTKHVADPTMLLTAEDYKVLIKNTSKSSGNLLCYVLDMTEEKQQEINAILKEYNLKPFTVNANVEAEWDSDKVSVQPPVEQWLRGFMDAELVVTDSFHACVFSILFHKPFVVVGNKGRGLTRVKSLLKMFGLEKALYSCNGNKNIDLNCIGIDWEDVNRRLQNLRKHSFNLLNKV